MRVSIRLKLSVFLAILLLTTISLLSMMVLKGIAVNQKKSYEAMLAQQTKIANLYIRQAIAMQPESQEDEVLGQKAQEIAAQLGIISGLHVILYDNEGTEIGNSFPTGDKVDVGDIMGYALEGKLAYQIAGTGLHYLAPVSSINRQIGVVQFFYSLEENHTFYNEIKRLFISLGMLIFTLSFIGGYIYFSSLVKAITRLKLAVDKVRQGSYEEKSVLRRKDELEELNEGIWHMSQRIRQNIEEMQNEQQKLRLSLEKLRALEQQQKHFIGNITHEFKTPLTVIKAYIDLMNMYEDDPKLLEEAKESIDKEAQRLYGMVDKTLHLAQLEKYDFELKQERLDVRGLLENVCKRMEGKACKFDLSMNTSLSEAYILADRESMEQIFINLLDNAIKYNKPKGRIDVSSYTLDNKAYIEIKDTGIGIPKEAADKVFEPFYRVDKDRSRQTGGTGLGLALVKELTEKQQGTIELSAGEEGTTFKLSFPITK